MAEWPFGRPINGEKNIKKSRKIAIYLFGHHGPMRRLAARNEMLRPSQAFFGAHTKNIFSIPTFFEVVIIRHAPFSGAPFC